MKKPSGPAWLEVDLTAIKRNIAATRRLVGPSTQVVVVVKANAYGHGLVQVGKAAEDACADGLAVALVEEGRQLREAGISIPILVLGSIPVGQAADAIESDLTCALCDPGLAEALSSSAVKLQRPARVEIKIDTGMGRIGLQPDELPAFLDRCDHLAGLQVKGVFSHLSCAEATDPSYSKLQYERFAGTKRKIGNQRPESRKWRWHLASSAAAAYLPECRLDGVRIGLLTYGLNPVAHLVPLRLEPVACWKTRITYMKDCPAGSSISYGRTYITSRPTRIATLGAGYADGYPRALSNRGEVLLGGRRTPIAGTVCMDQMMIEIPADMPASVGDEVVLMGSQGTETITTQELADRAGAVMHEILARLGARLERVYL